MTGITTLNEQENKTMAATNNVETLPDQRCPDCGSGFARDLKGIGYRRHLKALPKRNAAPSGGNGTPVICGGTRNSWDKGNRS
jgi:hypothetical protein